MLGYVLYLLKYNKVLLHLLGVFVKKTKWTYYMETAVSYQAQTSCVDSATVDEYCFITTRRVMNIPG